MINQDKITIEELHNKMLVLIELVHLLLDIEYGNPFICETCLYRNDINGLPTQRKCSSCKINNSIGELQYFNPELAKKLNKLLK